jgi:dipeptidyl aminopeptidase/acylaminoacyl peptidase
MHRVRNLGLTLFISLLLAAIVIFIFLIGQIVKYARYSLEPPLMTVEPGALSDLRFEDVIFTTEDDIALSGWYVPPQNGAVIILLHGYEGNRMQMIPEARLLAAAGYGVLLFDFRGSGISEQAMVTLGDHERRDLRVALDFVEQQPGVERIGALGFSMGAATLTQVAAEDERLQAVIIEATFPDLESTLEYRTRLLGPISQLPSLWAIRERGVDVDDVRPVDDICAISPRPVLLIYGDQDVGVPPGSAQTMYDAACDPVELWIIAGASHGDYILTEPEVYPVRVLAFFEAYLLEP